MLSVWEKEYQNPDYYQWGVVRKRDGTLIGAISAFEDEEGLTLEVGYCYGKAYWNHGYATEALRAVCAFLFDEVHLDCISCGHAKENPASGAVMRKVGFACTGESVYHKFNGTEVACYAYKLTPDKFIRHALL
ncbi:MAG: GNAT family N-acetyltransferase [Oscillospiraceae bacterium]|nr:GNAT family N-acetyltransferase [Oscillospiraceae bacterium]